MKEVYSYEDDDEKAFRNPWLPEGFSLLKRVKGYSVYHISNGKERWIDIAGSKHATRKSYFMKVHSQDEAIEFIDLIANRVRD